MGRRKAILRRSPPQRCRRANNTSKGWHYISMLIMYRLMNDSLAFLISDTARLMRRRFDERAREIGVTRAQWRALTTINHREGINQGGLAELIEVEPISLCRMIDRLEEAGLVERRRDPSDRRAWQLYLTDKARPLIAHFRGLADALVEHALHGLDEARQAQLADALGVIRANLTTPAELDEARHG